jgi:class 3 adenylate cyclase
MSAHLLASRADGRSTGARVSLPRAGRGQRCTAWQWSPERTNPSPYVLTYPYSRPRGKSPDACRDAGRFLTTVLITDIVESTATATRLGDRSWRDVLAAHYSACRAQVRHAAGELVNTTGDGIVATFDGPARAVRAALAIQAMARESGIAVRAGLHTGECEVMGDDIGGIAVHIAARVSALAGPSEVLVSRTVKDLVAGSGLEFAERGEHELKGVPDTWDLYEAAA